MAQGTRVFCGGVDEQSQPELEREFSRYGKVAQVWVARNPPGFAFVTMEDERDADDAVAALDGKNGWKVERARPSRREGGGFGGRGGGGFGGGGGGGGYGGGGGDRYGGGGGGYGDRPAYGQSKCYACGELGHFARECPQGGAGGGGGGRGGGGYERRDYDRRDDRYDDRRRDDDRRDRDYDRRDRSPQRSRSPRRDRERRDSPAYN